MASFTNIAAYKFTPLQELERLRGELRRRCLAADLKGTVLLSPEGINLFISGREEKVTVWLEELRGFPGLEDLRVKVSRSAKQPFGRMLVKIKKEIISFGAEGIDPSRRPSPKLDARILRAWLDEGRPLTLLDTRNDYEVRFGTFRGALPAGIDHFRDFPDAVARLPAALKTEPVVIFCTGGIRCEKAGPFLERAGFQQVYQLDGGILQYFEDCGGAHYSGDCFVFDERGCVDPALRETKGASPAAPPAV
ncbi:MAG: hypothetical protein RIQ93_2395 [Verrucomicrobiota bacterium]